MDCRNDVDKWLVLMRIGLPILLVLIVQPMSLMRIGLFISGPPDNSPDNSGLYKLQAISNTILNKTIYSTIGQIKTLN